MYAYIKRLHFICKIYFFSLFLSLSFLSPTENGDEVEGEDKLHYSFQNGSRSPPKVGHRRGGSCARGPSLCFFARRGDITRLVILG